MFEVKIYVVQKKSGEVLALKLTRAAAQVIATDNAPCRVLFMLADKSPVLAAPIGAEPCRLSP